MTQEYLDLKAMQHLAPQRQVMGAVVVVASQGPAPVAMQQYPAGQPVMAQPGVGYGQPVYGAPVQYGAQPMQPMQGQPYQGQPMMGQPMMGQPYQGQPQYAMAPQGYEGQQGGAYPQMGGAQPQYAPMATTQ
jgi:hypothetical protein